MTAKSKYSVSADGIDAYLFDLRKAAWRLANDMDAGNIAVSALVWYVRTGRAGPDFLRAMFSHRPSTIARRCLEGGTRDEVIARIKVYLKIK